MLSSTFHSRKREPGKLQFKGQVKTEKVAINNLLDTLEKKKRKTSEKLDGGRKNEI